MGMGAAEDYGHILIDRGVPESPQRFRSWPWCRLQAHLLDTTWPDRYRVFPPDLLCYTAAMDQRRLPDRIHRDWEATGRSWTARLCRAMVHCMGWRLIMDLPAVDKVVVVFYPHTSNWDFVLGLLTIFGLGLPVTWAGKDSLFRWPFTGLWTRLGGIPINRREHTGFVAQMAAEFARRKRMMLAIAPEGTRRRTDNWKSGFYRVALAARVPLGLAFIDFKAKEVGVGGLLEPTGDVAVDFAALRAFYSGKTARHPDQAGPIALKPGATGP
jgi:Acyltransferase